MERKLEGLTRKASDLKAWWKAWWDVVEGKKVYLLHVGSDPFHQGVPIGIFTEREVAEGFAKEIKEAADWENPCVERYVLNDSSAAQKAIDEGRRIQRSYE